MHYRTCQDVRVVLVEARDCGNAVDGAGTDGEGVQSLTHGGCVNHTHLCGRIIIYRSNSIFLDLVRMGEFHMTVLL